MSKSSPSVKPKPHPGSRNSFRIIAGKWRGRRLDFPEATTVRPTGDRVRETLFNWLQPYVAGAQVLDLFAGSGALGLEALSRAAAAATFVEQDVRLAKALKQHVAALDTEAAVVVAALPDWLQTQNRSWDLVFLDPPYPANLWSKCLTALAAGRLADGALVYTEHATSAPALVLPAEFSLVKERSAGQVHFMLLRYDKTKP